MELLTIVCWLVAATFVSTRPQNIIYLASPGPILNFLWRKVKSAYQGAFSFPEMALITGDAILLKHCLT